MSCNLIELARSGQYDAEKDESYLSHYESLFSPLRERPIHLMEIGVLHGGSLRLWRDYFTRGSINGIDINPAPEVLNGAPRIRFFQADQSDAARMEAIAREAAPDGFDIIIDDASHLGSHTAAAFQVLFERYLRPGGYYCIEDWGTGYWDRWPDGRKPQRLEIHSEGIEFPSHQCGMVGLVKQLVDQCGILDVYHPTYGAPGSRSTSVGGILIWPGLAIVERCQLEPASSS